MLRKLPSSPLRSRPRSNATAATRASRAPWGWAAAGVLAGALPALLVFAPAQWLAQARRNARATPVEARLTRSATAAAPAGQTPVTLGRPVVAMPRWDGTLVLALPTASNR